MAQKRITFIPENSSPLQEKIINYIMRRGKKNAARKIFANTLEQIQKKGHKNPMQVLEKAIENCKPLQEVRPKRIGGGVYQIPFEVKGPRALALALRWILNAVRGKKGAAMAVRLSGELLEAFQETGAAYKKRMDTERMALANKAFAHFAKGK